MHRVVDREGNGYRLCVNGLVGYRVRVGNEDNNVEQMWEQMKRAMVDGIREVYC